MNDDEPGLIPVPEAKYPAKDSSSWKAMDAVDITVDAASVAGFVGLIAGAGASVRLWL